MTNQVPNYSVYIYIYVCKSMALVQQQNRAQLHSTLITKNETDHQTWDHETFVRVLAFTTTNPSAAGERRGDGSEKKINKSRNKPALLLHCYGKAPRAGGIRHNNSNGLDNLITTALGHYNKIGRDKIICSSSSSSFQCVYRHGAMRQMER